MGKKHKRIKRETLISYLMIAPEMILMLIFITAHLDVARGAGNLRKVFDRLVGRPGETGDVDARALELAHRGAILIVKDRGEQMHGLEKLVVVRES